MPLYEAVNVACQPMGEIGVDKQRPPYRLYRVVEQSLFPGGPVFLPDFTDNLLHGTGFTGEISEKSALGAHTRFALLTIAAASISSILRSSSGAPEWGSLRTAR